MFPYVAYLRVYEPLSAFDEDEAARLASHVQETSSSQDGVSILRAEQQHALAATVGAPKIAAPEPEHVTAYRLQDGDELFVCPNDMRLRSWLALAQLIDELGDEHLRLLSPGSLEHTNPEFLRWRQQNPDAVPHIRQQTWQIPPVWFLLVERSENEFYTADGRRSVRFRTSMLRARRRCARAYSVVRRAFDAGPISEAIGELASWLESFHPQARVELDYAGLAQLLGPDLDDDTSPDDVAGAVSALAEGDLSGATEAYERVVTRWQFVRMSEHAN